MSTQPVSKPRSLSFRFVFASVSIAEIAALLGSIAAVFITLTFFGLLVTWLGFRSTEFTVFELTGFLSAVAILSVPVFLLSAIPAFIGGLVLAWLLHRERSTASNSNPRKMNLGAMVGAAAGVVAALCFLIPANLLMWPVQNRMAYSLLESLLIDLFIGAQCIAIATLAGMWTDSQLRIELENEKPSTAG